VSFTDGDQALMDTMIQTWASTADLLRSLPEDDWKRPTFLEGWNVQAIVSHLVGFESQWFLGRTPQVAPLNPLPPHVQNSVAADNERWVVQWDGLSPQAMIAEFDSMVEARSKHLNAARFYPQGFDTPIRTFRGDQPMREAIKTRIFDTAIHEQDIRQACELLWNPVGPGIAMARAQMISSLGFVAGKQAGLPDGSVVAVTLYGSFQSTVGVLVEDGKGRLVPPAEHLPMAAVTMHDEIFMMVTTGRVPAEEALQAERIKLRGDTDLAQRFALAMRVLAL
jgi:uncharacterized protein (TIGR03083 family)